MKNKDIRERAFEFALRIIKLCNELNKRPGGCRETSRQLLKAGPQWALIPKRHKRPKVKLTLSVRIPLR
jgi:hypothetical protein